MNLYIKETAKRYGISMTELAKRLNISITALSTIANNQSGKTYVSTLEKIANAIGCNISELLNEQPQTHISASDSVININTSNYISNTICPYCGRKIDVHISVTEHTPE